jgi:poly(3-hydroxybutyrate) depolymerase
MNAALNITLRAMAALCAGSLAACGNAPTNQGGATPAQLGAATGGPLKSCGVLAVRFDYANTQIDSALGIAEGELKLGDKAMPAHCVVKGQMFKRKGSDGRDYAIGFEMRLPQAWNGRYFYQGNGGLDGAVQPALGVMGGGPLTGALMQGFAVISADAGHTGPQTPFFGLEPQARLDYGYQAVGKLTPMAKALIAQAYGKGPDRSYIGGCSNGGRHAMVAAVRYGDEYDGYLVGAPGYRLPNAALAQLWGAQQWKPLATDGATTKHPLNPNATLPDLATAFTPQERQLVAAAVLAKCDALDGAQDGMVHATQACQAAFNVHTALPTCTGVRDGSCLTSQQKQVLASTFAGGRTTAGKPIYASFPYDPGISGSDWATWKFVNSQALDPLAVGTVFSAPPSPVDPFKVDVNAQFDLVNATSGVYQESGVALMTPPGNSKPENLSALRTRGGKMILYHGVSDPIFSADDTRQWFERLNQVQAGKADQFARYFPVPGMNHCRGGPATDQMDLLTPLVRWVENGEAPQALVASVRGKGNLAGDNAELPADWSPTRTRPLCAYPGTARYKGQGNVEDASNFECR